MIVSFAGRHTEEFWNTGRGKTVPANLRRVAQRKLLMVDAAANLEDLKVPPGNRLHALAGDRAGQHSISINDQFRICFVWKDGNAHNVEIVDYH